MLDSAIKKAIAKNPEISKEDIEKKEENQRKRLIQNNKAIMYAFCGIKLDCQIIWKSKKLHFERIIDANWLIHLILEGGYVEFKDVAKITGFSKGLAYLAESFNVLEEYRKTTFPHKFATLLPLELCRKCSFYRILGRNANEFQMNSCQYFQNNFKE